MDFDSLHIVAGSIATDTGNERILYEEGNSFAYQRADGTTERITVEGADIKISGADAELCEEVLRTAQIKFEETGTAIAGIIYALNGVYVLDSELETAYFVKLPDCEIEEEFEITVSDFD